ncbi:MULTISPECIES: YjaG family protein [Gilliamella]|uniref:DUF416 domain-containing protein n=1 Tax=Gilliamella apis TaxID=1970738 RepID=A0A2V4DWQ7_9GAMM|nr:MULTISPECIES: DUF416 family protein [Gilliamella]MBI0038254.1 DUF416 family protein [Gilliamella sp. B14384G10]MBI0040449.1 DUF416 family protein [Gilliamella sp. B14384G7]MBI0052288.1 DUF416 family protein [Gilliamella sp. B14384G13]MBI0054541.1 DUF416 family protein [Gilliamella sp. B14384H2]PXY88557.1 DUF416 domain-containing protein [Gilliamella apis]
MIKNPVQLRIAKLAVWQQRLFMVCLCERMYPNFVYYCHLQQDEQSAVGFKKILDLIWESLLVENVKINFDLQLEKLELIIPILNEDSPYMVYPAIDACQALSEILHSYISGEIVEHSAKVSSISATTVAEFEMTRDNIELSEQEQSQLPSVIEEFDLQWDIFRLLSNENNEMIDLIKGLKEDIRSTKTSNIGVFLSD